MATWEALLTSAPNPQTWLQTPIDPTGDAATHTITIDPVSTFQTWHGTGANLTDASVAMMTAYPDMIPRLFDPGYENGASLTMLRVPMSATDMSTTEWTWEYDPITETVTPPLQAQRQIDMIVNDILPLNPNIKIMTTAWTAPARYKTGNSTYGVGSTLKNRAVLEYADMLVKMCEYMENAGVPIWATTCGNEPFHSDIYPTMAIDIDTMVDMANRMKPGLEALGIELWALDHNWEHVEQAQQLVSQTDAFDGVAFHCYGGDAANMDGFDVPVIMNECTGTDDNWYSTFAWDSRNLYELPAEGGSVGAIFWNLALDDYYGPYKAWGSGCTNCRGLLNTTRDGVVEGSAEYYLQAHLRHAGDPGALVISSSYVYKMPNVAFNNPDGSIGIYIMNDTFANAKVDVNITGFGSQTYNFEGGEILSIRVQGGLYAVQSASVPLVEWEIYDEEGGNLMATATEGSYTVVVEGTERTLTEQISTGGIQDRFIRTLEGSWGSTEESGRWNIRTGDDADYDVEGDRGVMTLDSVNESRRIAPSSYGYDYSYATVDVKVRTDKLPVKGDQYACIMNGYVSISNHYLATLEFSKNLSQTDRFSRADQASTWGTSESGSDWATSGGVDADYYTAASVAYIDVDTVNSSRRTTVEASDDHEVLVRVASAVAPTGGSIYLGPILRYEGFDNHYLARLRLNPSGNAELDFQKYVASTPTSVGTAHDLGTTIGANEWWWVRARIDGTTLSAKAWAQGSAEPPTWQITATDSDITTGGRAGVRAYLSPANTNTLPVVAKFDDFTLLDGLDADSVPTRLKIQRRLSGTTTTLGEVALPWRYSAGDWWNIKFDWAVNGDMQARAWPDGETEPAYQITGVNDLNFDTGDTGLRAFLTSTYDTDELPVRFEWQNYTVDAEWVNPHEVTHNKRVYTLGAPFASTPFWGPSGIGTEASVTHWYTNEPEDLFDIAMSYTTNGENDAAYNDNIDSTGFRVAGADFNDYFGIEVYYPGEDFLDEPEAGQIGALDCSGYTRMVFGYHGGIPMVWAQAAGDGTTIPRTSKAQELLGPGSYVFDDPSNPPSAAEITYLKPGDQLYWDAGVGTDEDEEGEIDHCGIYLGVDTEGKPRFVSSRKTINGPTMSDIGGKSSFDFGDTNLYSRSLRSARRF